MYMLSAIIMCVSKFSKFHDVNIYNGKIWHLQNYKKVLLFHGMEYITAWLGYNFRVAVKTLYAMF